jgi:hypothetical protein
VWVDPDPDEIRMTGFIFWSFLALFKISSKPAAGVWCIVAKLSVLLTTETRR